MNIIIHKITYHVVNNKEEVQALFDAGEITRKDADLWFNGLDLEKLNGVSLTLEIRDNKKEEK